jgi:N-acetylmuramoyl-L-alanine amidase
MTVIASLLAALALGSVIGCGGGDDDGMEPDPGRERDSNRTSDSPPRRSDRCERIVVDPGHDSAPNPDKEPIGPNSQERKIKDGGGTQGVVTGVPEHEVTLAISLRLRPLLVRRGFCVTMTRSRATGRSLGNIERSKIANRGRAALFVRVHADGSPNRQRNGTSVLYPAFHPGWTDDILPESRTAARILQEELVRELRSRDLGIVPRRDLTGFNWADVPAVLVEIGLMSNPREDRLLTTPSYQRRAARALARGIERSVQVTRTDAAAGGSEPQ